MVVDTTFLTVAHGLIGTCAVLSGALALVLPKGPFRHRLAGPCFTVLIVAMVPIVCAEALLKPGSISPLGIVFVFLMAYLVVTSWATVRTSKKTTERTRAPIDIIAPVTGLCISIYCYYLGVDALATPAAGDAVPPNEVYFFFGTLMLVATLLDLIQLRERGTGGKHRIIRHIWRNAFALFLATSTLFTGPGSIVFPEFVQGNSLLVIPQLLVAIFALYWISKIQFKKNSTGRW